MHGFRRLKGALRRVVAERRRLTVTAVVVVVGFVVGALLPGERMLAGVAVGALIVALAQLFHNLIDRQDEHNPPPPPPDGPITADTSGGPASPTPPTRPAVRSP